MTIKSNTAYIKKMESLSSEELQREICLKGAKLINLMDIEQVRVHYSYWERSHLYCELNKEADILSRESLNDAPKMAKHVNIKTDPWCIIKRAVNKLHEIYVEDLKISQNPLLRLGKTISSKG